MHALAVSLQVGDFGRCVAALVTWIPNPLVLHVPVALQRGEVRGCEVALVAEVLEALVLYSLVVV